MRYTQKHSIFMAGVRTSAIFDIDRHADNSFYFLDVLISLSKTATKHHRLCEASCNGFKTETEDAANDAAIKKLEESFSYWVGVLSRYAKDTASVFNAEFQHDPRGLTCRIMQTTTDGTKRDISFIYLMEW